MAQIEIELFLISFMESFVLYCLVIGNPYI